MMLHNIEYDLADFEPDIPFPIFFLMPLHVAIHCSPQIPIFTQTLKLTYGLKQFITTVIIISFSSGLDSAIIIVKATSV